MIRTKINLFFSCLNSLVVLPAVKQSGMALQFASEEFKEDRVIVLHAVRKSPSALEFASPTLQRDPRVIEMSRRPR